MCVLPADYGTLVEVVNVVDSCPSTDYFVPFSGKKIKLLMPESLIFQMLLLVQSSHHLSS
jgi:hypothetical protein